MAIPNDEILLTYMAMDDDGDWRYCDEEDIAMDWVGDGCTTLIRSDHHFWDFSKEAWEEMPRQNF